MTVGTSVLKTDTQKEYSERLLWEVKWAAACATSLLSDRGEECS